jgi:hypothetical protein
MNEYVTGVRDRLRARWEHDRRHVFTPEQIVDIEDRLERSRRWVEEWRAYVAELGAGNGGGRSGEGGAE